MKWLIPAVFTAAIKYLDIGRAADQHAYRIRLHFLYETQELDAVERWHGVIADHHVEILFMRRGRAASAYSKV